MKIALFQTENLPFDKAKLSFYIQRAKKEGASLIVLPEYVLNRFFKELENIPLSFIKDQSRHQIKLLKNLSTIYNITIIAPVIKVIKDKKFKTIIKFSPNGLKYYYQQILMPYSHWNEAKFFDVKKSLPMIFNIEGIKFGVIFGFEIHFPKFWDYFKSKNVDCVLIPSVGTFNSHKRWFELLKSKAFLYNMYVVRANRVGFYENWEFYGKSFVIDPEGEVITILGNKEEIGIVEINKNKIKEARKEWKFSELEKLINF